VDLPHQWDGCGTLCYLGAFAMSASAVEPSLSYLDVVRYSNPAEIASDMDVLATAARGLGYTVEVSATTRDGRDSFVAKFEDVGRAGPTFAGAKEALEALQAHVLAGRVAIAHVDIAYILEDRQRASPEYNDLGHAPHFLAVVGFDADHVYVHDPQKWQAFAQYMPLRKAAFLEAWGAQDHRTLLAVKSGTRASRDVAFSAMAHRLAETPHEMVRSARRFERKGTVEEMQMVALMSAAYRRRVTSTWLAERGLSESASLLAQSASVFEGIRPNLTASQVSGILRQAADLESRAVSLLVGAP